MVEKKSHLLHTAAFVLLCLIPLYAIFLRIYQVELPSWWMDEGYSVNAAIATLERGYPVLDSGEDYSAHILETYILAGSIKLFGLNEWATRLPSVVWNLIAITTIFLFAKRFLGTKIALITGLLLIFSYWEIAWARQARFYAMYQAFFWLSILFFWRFLFEHYRATHLGIACFFALCTFFTNPAGLLLLPIAALTTVIHRHRYSAQLQVLPKKTWLMLIIGAASFTALITALQPTLWQKIYTLMMNPLFYLPKYLAFIRDHLLWSLLLAIGALWYNSALSKKKGGVVVAILWCVFLLPLGVFSFFVPLLHYRYLFVLWPALYMLAAVTLTSWYDSCTTGQKRMAFVSVAILTTLLYNTLFHEFQLLPQTAYALESDRRLSHGYISYTPQPNWREAYAFISKIKKKNDILISAQPVLTQLYTGEPGYWIAHSLTNQPHTVGAHTHNPYVAAPGIHSLQTLRTFTNNTHGYIVLDSLSTDNRISEDILAHIQTLPLVFFDELNQWSRVWVYKF